MSFILFLLAFILIVLIAPIGLIAVTFISMFTLDSKLLRDYYYDLAYVLDCTGNVVMSGLFNIILIKKDSKHLFGNPKETISSVLGKNKLDKSLIWSNEIIPVKLETFKAPIKLVTLIVWGNLSLLIVPIKLEASKAPIKLVTLIVWGNISLLIVPVK